MLNVTLENKNQAEKNTLDDLKDFSNLTGFFALLIKIDERNKLKNNHVGNTETNDRHSNTYPSEIQS